LFYLESSFTDTTDYDSCIPRTIGDGVGAGLTQEEGKQAGTDQAAPQAPTTPPGDEYNGSSQEGDLSDPDWSPPSVDQTMWSAGSSTPTNSTGTPEESPEVGAGPDTGEGGAKAPRPRRTTKPPSYLQEYDTSSQE
jgi:hypothetical protein